eukprot:CAMPEP_0180672854 /NCGR_PEP_ID=MMETSP1037_2-20121125/65371_1 /TAXON_ID=632150 /ORGANISM="Azadinium spinosum, Strain 3D9" /LENGTH=74 /DNA_ID=CAMNT_0022702059 /DNA_START=465 /DNA_END=689 /DNA_ORIENTATION=-
MLATSLMTSPSGHACPVAYREVSRRPCGQRRPERVPTLEVNEAHASDVEVGTDSATPRQPSDSRRALVRVACLS